MAISSEVGHEEPPIVSRLDRLDNMLRHLEEMRGRGFCYTSSGSPARSSCTSTTPSNCSTPRAGGGGSGRLSFLATTTAKHNSSPSSSTSSSVDSTPCRSSLEKHCRPIDDVIMETQLKGNLIDRLVHVEDRLFKLCLQVEEEMREMTPIKSDGTKKKKTGLFHHHGKEEDEEGHHHEHKSALKQFVKSCVKGGKTKTKKRT
ncbi:hypothetical protein MKX01_039283 [Papaver californicum]|nr:hypothetical protein MKX01_039283 [Papaver californicum]